MIDLVVGGFVQVVLTPFLEIWKIMKLCCLNSPSLKRENGWLVLRQLSLLHCCDLLWDIKERSWSLIFKAEILFNKPELN
jgi:hypothetical protein